MGVWTGREAIVWGGDGPGPTPRGTLFADGAAYDPLTGRWQRLPPAPLTPRIGADAVWTGTEMLIWGGFDALYGASARLRDGAAYNPTTHRWRRLPPAPLPAGTGEVSVWTGRQFLLWVGDQGAAYGPQTGPSSPGAAYDPLVNRWRRVSPAPHGVVEFNRQLVVWTGSEVIAPVPAPLPKNLNLCSPAGGCGSPQPAVQFAAYGPTSDRWRTLAPPPPSVEAMAVAAGAWVNGRMIVVQDDGGTAIGDPAHDRWRLVPNSGPVFHRQPVLVRMSGEVLAQGGGNAEAPALIEAAFDTATGAWRTLPAPPLGSRVDATELDAGGRLLIWGGVDEQTEKPGTFYGDGAILDLRVGQAQNVLSSSAATPQVSSGHPAQPPPPRAEPFPPTIAVHLPTATAHPGQILLVDSETGATLRSFGAEYDPYVSDGFALAADRSALYYSRLNEPAQKIEIVRAPLGQAGSSVIADGTDERPSPDGRQLAFRPMSTSEGLAVMDLASGAVRTYPPPPAPAGSDALYLSWLADNRSVVVITSVPGGTSGGACFAPAGRPSCGAPPTTATPPPPEAWLLDTSRSNPSWARLPTPAQSNDGWGGYLLLGPGRVPESLAVGWSYGHSADIMTVMTDGSVYDKTALAPDSLPLSVDATGTNFLIADRTGLARMSLSDPAPVPIRGPVAEAAW